MVDYNNREANVSGRSLVDIKGFNIGGGGIELEQTSIKEIVLAESLLTPGLQTSVTFQSFVYFPVGKNFDKFKNKPMVFTLESDNAGVLPVSQISYRLDNRKFQPTNTGATEEFIVHACDQTLLNDAQTLVSKSWKCTRPSDVVSYALQSCAGAGGRTDVEECDPSRDYIAENIHPFQVVAQQSNVALAGGNDPSFLHYMTYRNLGTHHFRSLKYLTSQGSVATFEYSDSGIGKSGGTQPNNPASGTYGNPNAVIAFSFPCDFDYLSDLLNGLDMGGEDQNSGGFFNPVSKSGSLLGNQAKGCGIGGYNYKGALTNYGTSKEQNSCNFGVEKYLLKRQARMALLEKDKIALRIMVPFNANLHVGQIITFKWGNKNNYNTPVYGTGEYLISSMMHTVRTGGFSTTTMDCVSKTVGQGVV
jgi:hypothetical protein